jgi:PAS domain S-box-containing protein
MSAPKRVRLPSWALVDAARIETDREGLIIAWNNAAEELYGYAAGDVIGQPVIRVVVPVRGRRQAAEIMHALALGQTWEGEFDVRRHDGRLVRVLVHDAPVYDADGAMSGVVGHSVPTAAQPPDAAVVRSSAGAWTYALREAIFDPSVGVGLRMRTGLIVAGAAFELAWSLVARAAGGESLGVAGAIAMIGVLAIAVMDAWAGVAVALLGAVAFTIVVSYAEPPAPWAYGSVLVAVWVAGALAAGTAALRLRIQAQRGVAEAVALHRELVGSLVPAPRLRRVDVSVASLYRPGEQRLELGGDFYAATERADNSIALLVGDVSGHGAEAAAMAAMLRAGWEALVEAGVAPQARLASLNQLLLAHARFEEFFATVCSVVIDADLTTATVTLAGHPPPFLICDGEQVALGATTGVPLGVSDLAVWTPTRIDLPRQFSLLLYTDGVIEGRARPGERDRFGEERLRDVVASSTARGRELLQQIIATASEAHGGPLPDDAALLLLERR